MKKIALLFIVLGASLHAMEITKPEGCADELPYIVLYMDINKTIIIESTGKGFGYEEGIAALLSTVPEYAYTWGNDLEKMTYNKWVDKKLFPGTDPALKSKRESYHTKFIEAVKNKNHPMAQEIIQEFESLIASLKEQGSRKIFTSFLNLITYLKEKNYSFSVVLRTFGKDLDRVSKELAQDGLHFIYGSFNKGILHLNNKKLSDPEEMILAFEPGKHYAIQDSYDWWKQHNFTEGGKPFPIDVSDKQVLSIFFDDNADDQIKPILSIMPVGKKVNLNELIAMGRVVPVDTRQAILDKNYFINAVEKALAKWKETFCYGIYQFTNNGGKEYVSSRIE